MMPFLGDLFNVLKNECIKNDEMFSGRKKSKRKRILHWDYASAMTSKSSNMTNVSPRVQCLVIKWHAYCSYYAPMLYCSK